MDPVLVQVGLFWIRVLWEYWQFFFNYLASFIHSPNIIWNAFTTKGWSYENKRSINGGSNLFYLGDTNSWLNSMLYLSICLPTHLPIKPSWNDNIQDLENAFFEIPVWVLLHCHHPLRWERAWCVSHPSVPWSMSLWNILPSFKKEEMKPSRITSYRSYLSKRSCSRGKLVFIFSWTFIKTCRENIFT